MAVVAKLVQPANELRIDKIAFGTDGWRAIIGDDFNTASLARVAEATARIFLEDNPAVKRPRIIVGYDCRENAGRYAVLAGSIIAAYGFDVVISNAYCPTPTLCFTIARDEQAIGGIMLTSSHNPAEYLGVKLRMADGGASPAAFTNRVEAALQDTLPANYTDVLKAAEAAVNGTVEMPATSLAQAPSLTFQDIMTPFLEELTSLVDSDIIAARRWRVVLDPMYGAGRHYLASVLYRLGLEDIVEVNGDNDSSFDGLHPEPIYPWIDRAAQAITELGYDACFITDGDADRIGALDHEGTFVSPHKILALVIGHLVKNKGLNGRVVRTLSGSNLVKRQCERFGLELVTTPVGFKWIYEEMLKGDVLIGGEESGGIGIPSHVRERDGLLMTLLLIELMSVEGKRLKELVDEMMTELGNFDYARRDLRISAEQKEAFLTNHVRAERPVEEYASLFASLGENISAIDRRDGIHLSFASDAWLLMRPSGTEPLVRVYAEATDANRVQELLDIGCNLVEH